MEEILKNSKITELKQAWLKLEDSIKEGKYNYHFESHLITSFFLT